MSTFNIYGYWHIALILLMSTLSIILPRFIYMVVSDTKRFFYTIGLLLISVELTMPLYSHYYLGYLWTSSWPLHLCDFSRMLIAGYCFTETGLLMDVAYFWGLGGASIAMMYPDIGSNFPSVESIYFFITHGLLTCSIFSAIFLRNFKPTYNGLLCSILGGILLSIFIYHINFTLGASANYWYLSHIPSSVSFIETYLPHKPFHLLAYYGIATLIFCFFYLVFYIHEKIIINKLSVNNL